MDDKRDALEVKEQGTQRSLVTHAVLVGLTPLIPLPFVDDLLKNYFRKRLLRSLAAANGRVLVEDELDALAAERERGCLSGCLLAALVYPLKAIFRKVFYFLEWKRAVDLTSRTYHFGYLASYAMRRREGGASALDLCGARAVGEAIQAVCREAPIKPLEGAVGGTFRQSKRVLRASAALLANSLRRLAGRARPEQVAEAVERVEPEEERELAPVVTRLQRSIASVPEEHFRTLRFSLDARLGLPTGEE
ncbi:MAG: hypothetical protein QOJ70_2648 [Acidobacteriota bacterium]|jgi:hypothetical protein|nr:hypothetical protein [Acidobacteriota bacterium]MDT7808835.1 hypothetical protein [Acidobacteriota bacterium]